jgi:predicted metalloprotease
MQWEGREESENVEDRRSMVPKAAAVGGGGIVILLIAYFLGVDPGQLANIVGGLGIGGGGGPPVNQQVAPQPADPAEEKDRHFTSIILKSTEDVWTDLFKRMGKQYVQPKLILFSGRVDSACGMAESAMGPFYCPGDSQVYIDLSFYKDMQRQLNAPGDFAKAYVVAHEVGHHVQRLLGYSQRVDEVRRRGNDLENHHASVRLELQADFLAGIWGYYAQKRFNWLEQGDVETALNAAFQIGDDRLQKKARGYAVPDSFTHGTSKQRQKWFMEGFRTGDLRQADALFSLKYDDL